MRLAATPVTTPKSQLHTGFTLDMARTSSSRQLPDSKSEYHTLLVDTLEPDSSLVNFEQFKKRSLARYRSAVSLKDTRDLLLQARKQRLVALLEETSGSRNHSKSWKSDLGNMYQWHPKVGQYMVEKLKRLAQEPMAKKRAQLERVKRHHEAVQEEIADMLEYLNTLPKYSLQVDYKELHQRLDDLDARVGEHEFLANAKCPSLMRDETSVDMTGVRKSLLMVRQYFRRLSILARKHDREMSKKILAISSLLPSPVGSGTDCGGAGLGLVRWRRAAVARSTVRSILARIPPPHKRPRRLPRRVRFSPSHLPLIK